MLLTKILLLVLWQCTQDLSFDKSAQYLADVSFRLSVSVEVVETSITLDWTQL